MWFVARSFFLVWLEEVFECVDGYAIPMHCFFEWKMAVAGGTKTNLFCALSYYFRVADDNLGKTKTPPFLLTLRLGKKNALLHSIVK